MREYLPLLIVCAVIGVFTILFLAAYAVLKRKTKEETSERHMSDSEIIKRLLGYARPYKKDFVLVFLIMLVSIAYDVVSPLLVADIQGTIKQSFELSRLYSLVAVYAGILAVSMVCTYFQAMILQKTGQKILSQIRLDTFTHIEQLSHAQLNQIPVGKLVTRVTNDPNSISYLFTNILVTLAKNSLVIIGVLAAMLILNYALTLMVLCFVPFLVIFTIIFQKFSRHVHRTVNNARTDVNTYLSENLSGMKVTQIFNQEQRKMDEFLARSKRLEKTKMNRMFVFGIFRPMVYMLFVTSNLFLFYIGCKGYIKDTTFLGQTITSETVVAFYMYISRFFNPIQALAEQFDMLEQSFAAAEKIFTILDMVPEVVDEPDAIELKEMKGEIEFRDVWFAYNPGEWVLKGVSFHVYPKQTVAFVGATGSGKSTILSLICRNYDIQKGQILIDGIDIRHIKIASLRATSARCFRCVPVRGGHPRNIVLRSDNVTDEDVWQACRYVNADGFIQEAGWRSGRGRPGAGQQLLRGSAAAAELRPDHSAQALRHDPGRSHRQHRHGDGGTHSGLSGEDEEHRHHADRSPSPEHHPACGQHYSAVPRRDHGAGHPSGASPPEGTLLPALYPPVPQAAASGELTGKSG